MGLLNKNSDQQNMVNQLLNDNKYLINEYFDKGEEKRLKQTLMNIQMNQGTQPMQNYFNSLIIQLQNYEENKNNYAAERAISRKHYGFFTGLSEKSTFTTGKLIAAQNIKIDTLIQQNNEIIRLLKELIKKE